MLQKSQLIKLISQLSLTNQVLSAIILYYNLQNSTKELTPGPGGVLESYEEILDSEDRFTTTKDLKVRLDRDNDINEDVEISCCPKIRFKNENKSKSQAPKSNLSWKKDKLKSLNFA